MIIKILPMVSGVLVPGGIPVILGADTRDHCVTEWPFEQERLFEKLEYTRGEYQSVANRFNRINQVEIIVERTWASAEDAAAYVMTHAESVPDEGKVIFSQVTSQGVVTRYLAVATISHVRSVRGKTMGVHTCFSYLISGGQLLGGSAPA
jgi:hypothetical protein